MPNGTVELRQRAASSVAEHDSSITETIGKRGFKTLQQKEAICRNFQGVSVCRPRTALRNFLLAPDVPEDLKDVDLGKVQVLKRDMFGSTSGFQQDLGDISTEVGKHKALPPARQMHKGFWAYANINRVDCKDGKSLPYVCAMATTRNLLHGFTTTQVCELDGGFKYNVLDWPCVLVGATNPNMHFLPCGIL